MSCRKKSYITTPIYYVNDIPHIGHAYTTIIADTLAIYSRLTGLDTYFLTGTDEHGQKIEEASLKQNEETKIYADKISLAFKNTWDDFNITYNGFIRTTDEDHKLGVQKAFKVMFDNGDIYKDVYKGNYCISCESFFSKIKLVDEEFCPECGKNTKIIEEESYFFKLSNYQNRLLEYYNNNDNFILPKSKKNEIIKFIESGLEDISITRTSFSWGIQLPNEMNDKKHIIYVWLDALMSYITHLGYGNKNKNIDFYPATVHLIGKDILKFHAVYWPAFLMSLNLPLPKHIGVHGWWTQDGEKMSKSKNNVINPKTIVEKYGLENFRYFMLREVPFGGDGDFSQKALISRINSDLGNDLGNLLNRLIGLSGKYFKYEVNSNNVSKYYSKEIEDVNAIVKTLEPLIFNLEIHKYLQELWTVLKIGNLAIQKAQPWNLIKNGDTEKAMALNGLVANILAKTSIMLHAVMPKTTNIISYNLGFKISTETYNKYIKETKLLDDFIIKKIEPLFPKIEPIKSENKKQDKQNIKKDKSLYSNQITGIALITIDKFFETLITIGTIIKIEEIKKSKKLYLLQVDMGEENPRQILAGIKAWYSREQLQDTQICVVSNLKPAKLMGFKSEGMLLAAKDNIGLSLIRPEHKRENGTVIG